MAALSTDRAILLSFRQLCKINHATKQNLLCNEVSFLHSSNVVFPAYKPSFSAKKGFPQPFYQAHLLDVSND
jgi:hypothetical protein